MKATVMFNTTNPSDLSAMSVGDMQRLGDFVRCRSRGWVRDLRLLVQGDGLVLQGHAPTFYAKQLAQEAVMEASRLAILANEIEVQ